ncbi:nucleoside triphosphate pyrophosphohydrolase family protein [Avibacterium paragallinarum]|uniref:nucleoside triphosphate pyrophosphohydrolase family protein n=1 Tax=Avibacterium paragallinarum TaxID=728 RepID=UPI00021ACE50|nr:nucleoside triphosphate pyrophosphohydrolase family protein [Avibacterium paragallinarum]
MVYQPFSHIPVNRNALPYDLPYQPKNEDKKMNNINITPIIDWFKTAIPQPTDKNRAVQIGVHFEEVAEMTTAIYKDGLQNPSIILDSRKSFSELSEHFKQDWLVKNNSFTNKQKKELLDSLCDQIVTAIGVAHMLGMDIQGALNEVNRSNWSKFENGKPVFNEQGKIAKGKNYFKPNLSNFINKGVL